MNPASTFTDICPALVLALLPSTSWFAEVRLKTAADLLISYQVIFYKHNFHWTKVTLILILGYFL